MKFLLRKNRAKTTVVKFDSFSTVVPEIVEKSIEHLSKNGGLELEGIFRIPGNFEKIKKLKMSFDKGKIPSFSKVSLYEVAGVLKLFFIELPEPLLTFELYEPMVACLEGTPENKISKLQIALSLLPPLNRCILTRLMGFLQEVGKRADKNKMTFSNLALIFGPHLLRSRKCSVPVTQENFIMYFISTSRANEICTLFLNHFDTLFSMDKRKSSSHSAPASSESASESSCSSVDQSSFKRKVKRATISLASSLLQEAEEMRNPTMDISLCVGEQTLKNPSELQVIEEKRLKFQESIIAVLLRQQSPEFKSNKTAPFTDQEKEDAELENQIEQWLVDFNKRASCTEINMAVKSRTKSSKSRTDSVSSRTSSSLFSTPSLSDLQSEEEHGFSPKRTSARHGKEPSTASPLHSPKHFPPRSSSEKSRSDQLKNSSAEEAPCLTPTTSSASIFKSTSASQAEIELDAPNNTSMRNSPSEGDNHTSTTSPITTATTTTTTAITTTTTTTTAATTDTSLPEKGEISAETSANENNQKSNTLTASASSEGSVTPENAASPHSSEPNTPTSASSKRTYTTTSRELTTPKLPSAQQILHSRSASSRRSERRQFRVDTIPTLSTIPSPKVSSSRSPTISVNDQADGEDGPPVTDEVLKVASYIRQGRMKDAKKYIIKQTFKDGSSFEGNFDDDGNYHGFGRFVYVDGNTYEGDYVHGVKEGQGKLIFRNGDSYVGGFSNNERHGWGKYTDAQGNVYEGEYVMGVREGRGEFAYQGSKYVGDFKGGVPNGKGKFFFSSGDIYEGDFVENVMHGKGKYKDNLGNSYEGDYFKGKRTGKGLFVNAKGNQYEGDFVDGVMSGKGTYTFADGDRYEGEFANGKFNGQGTYFFASKKQSLSGTFKDGKHVKQ